MELLIRHLKVGVTFGGVLPAIMAFAPASDAFDSYASIERGRRDLPKVALTFDGGGEEGFSGRILSILEEKGVRATFFLTGEYVKKYPGHVLRMVDAGHEIGNHTWSHPHLTAWELTRRQDTLPGLDRGFLLRELENTARAFSELTGREMLPLWRAPFGEVNGELLRWAAVDGYRHIAWTRDGAQHRNLDSLDWVADRSSRLYLNSVRIRDRLLEFGHGDDGLNGGIVLMHLCTRKVDPGVTRLGELIDALRERGYRLVPVTELLHDLDLAPPFMIGPSAPGLGAFRGGAGGCTRHQG